MSSFVTLNSCVKYLPVFSKFCSNIQFLEWLYTHMTHSILFEFFCIFGLCHVLWIGLQMLFGFKISCTSVFYYLFNTEQIICAWLYYTWVTLSLLKSPLSDLLTMYCLLYVLVTAVPLKLLHSFILSVNYTMCTRRFIIPEYCDHLDINYYY